MKLPTNTPVKIVMLGAGGTGGHIAPHIYRLLYALDRPSRFIICDGDKVEDVYKRQSFHGNRHFVGRGARWHGFQPKTLLSEDLPNQ